MSVKFDVKDKLYMKKSHPCGSFIFTVLRGGTDVRIVCDGCGRDITLSREKLEPRIKTVLPKNENR